MTTEEAKAAIRAIKIDGPTVLFIDMNQVDIAALSSQGMFDINLPVLIIPTDGTPTVASLTLEELKECVQKLETA